MAKRKKRRKKGSAWGTAAGSAGSHTKSRSGGYRRSPTQKAKNAYYKNVRKAYSKLKRVAEVHGFA